MASGALDIFFPHKAVTQGIVVRVSVSYLADQSEPKRGRWFWAYHIRIENQSAATVQLMTRRWIITDAHGNRTRVEGEGVIGEQPVIGAGETYDYVSGCPLETRAGHMEGAYQMAGSGGGMLDVLIPRFPLTVPREEKMKRTLLPLNGLRVLDAAARHLSFTRAADELAVTPAAVGQQIRALEDTLGVVLFRRTAKGLELTPEGERGLDALRQGFLEFEDAVRAMQAGQSSKTLTIAAPRGITAKWLGPRLAAYGQGDPELRFTIIPADVPLDFTEANLDLAVCFSASKGNNEGVALGDLRHILVGRADAPAAAITWPGAPSPSLPVVLQVGDAGLAIDAAAAGFGRALVPALVAQADLAVGRLVSFGEVEGERGYWLIAPVPQWRQKKVRALVEALTQARLG